MIGNSIALKSGNNTEYSRITIVADIIKNNPPSWLETCLDHNVPIHGLKVHNMFGSDCIEWAGELNARISNLKMKLLKDELSYDDLVTQVQNLSIIPQSFSNSEGYDIENF